MKSPLAETIFLPIFLYIVWPNSYRMGYQGETTYELIWFLYTTKDE
jgi:hypothetical protein